MKLSDVLVLGVLVAAVAFVLMPSSSDASDAPAAATPGLSVVTPTPSVAAATIGAASLKLSSLLNRNNTL
ncbi:MAG TPA: hypothetical protein VGG48_19060 [Rhizomicrobium sp.]|jgi:hypothetical protein